MKNRPLVYFQRAEIQVSQHIVLKKTGKISTYLAQKTGCVQIFIDEKRLRFNLVLFLQPRICVVNTL